MLEIIARHPTKFRKLSKYFYVINKDIITEHYNDFALYNEPKMPVKEILESKNS